MKIAYFTNTESKNLKDTIIVSTNKDIDDSLLLPNDLISSLYNIKFITDEVKSYVDDIRDLGVDLIISDNSFGLSVFANYCATILDIPLMRIIDEKYENYKEFLDENKELYCNNCVKVFDDKKNINLYYKEAILSYKDSLIINKVNIKDDYVVLYLDNNEKMYISFDIYEYGNFVSGKKVSQLNYNYLKEKESELLAYMSALRKLSIKDYSIKEIRDFIYKKYKLNTKKIDNIINKLVEYNLLDDYTYALNKVDYYLNSSLSTKAIKQKLIKSGISDEIIDKTLVVDEKSEASNALNKALKYQNTIRNKSLNATKQAIYSKLISDGFGYNIVKEVIDKLDFETTIDKENELLIKEANKSMIKYQKKFEGRELKNKIISSLLSKGFNYDIILKILNDLEVENE